jgi:hypothetical protein
MIVVVKAMSAKTNQPGGCMSKTIKQFDYQIIKMAKGDDLPFNPHVEIVLDHFTSKGNGPPIISPDLMSDGEIDEYVEQLKADIGAVGKRAKDALSRAKGETKAIVSNRNSN